MSAASRSPLLVSAPCEICHCKVPYGSRYCYDCLPVVDALKKAPTQWILENEPVCFPGAWLLCGQCETMSPCMILYSKGTKMYYGICPGSVARGRHIEPDMFLISGSMYKRLDRFLWATTQKDTPNWPFVDFETTLRWYKPAWLRIQTRELPHYSK